MSKSTKNIIRFQKKHIKIQYDDDDDKSDVKKPLWSMEVNPKAAATALPSEGGGCCGKCVCEEEEDSGAKKKKYVSVCWLFTKFALFLFSLAYLEPTFGSI